jgi:hypothetical protein
MHLIKYKHIVALFIIGFIVNLFAALQKILHTPNADFLFKIAFYIMATSGVIAVIKLLMTKNKDSFLDK